MALSAPSAMGLEPGVAWIALDSHCIAVHTVANFIKEPLSTKYSDGQAAILQNVAYGRSESAYSWVTMAAFVQA